MKVSLQSQVCTFGLALIFGIFLGIIYDIFRVNDEMFGINFKRIFVEDILFFIFAGILTFLFLLATGNGDFKIFVVFAELIGALLWHFTIGKLLLKVSSRVICFYKEKISKISNKFSKKFNIFCQAAKKFVVNFRKNSNKRKMKKV